MKQEKRSLRQRIHDFYYTEPSKPAKKQKEAPPQAASEQEEATLRRMKAVCIALAVLILAAVGIIVWLLVGRGAQEDASAAAPVYDPDAVVLSADGYSMTNLQFSYYFWSEYVYTLSGSTSAPFDTSVALDEQWYDSTTTWEDYLIEQAMNTAKQTAALSAAAEAAGFTLPEDYQNSLDEQLSAYRQRAEDGGYSDVDAFLVSLYGEGATEQTFSQYLQDSFVASAYSDMLYAEPSFTDQEISDYYDRYADEYAQELGIEKDDSCPCDLRCIFLTPETDDEAGWAAVKEQADTIYAQWQADPTEEAFAALAEEYNQDTLAEEGGLYASVTQGQAEDVIDQWCFDPARTAGDTTLLEIASGYVLIYYSARGDTPSWKLSAEADLRYEAYQSTITGLVDDFGFTVHTDAIVLVTPSALAADAVSSNE